MLLKTTLYVDIVTIILNKYFDFNHSCGLFSVSLSLLVLTPYCVEELYTFTPNYEKISNVIQWKYICGIIIGREGHN